MKIDSDHPAEIIRRENEAIRRLADRAEHAGRPEEALGALLSLKGLKQHYGIKEELLLPLIDPRAAALRREGVFSEGEPFSSDAVWEEDGRIKKELSALIKRCGEEPDSSAKEAAASVCGSVRAMADLEDAVLLPFALAHLTEEEWCGIYRDLADMGLSFTERSPHWETGEQWVRNQREREASLPVPEGLIRTETGSLTVKQLEGILRCLPVDMTFIDADDVVRFYTNEGKTFSRVQASIGRKVWQCHPPAKVPVVRSMIERFKSGARDHADVWFDRGEKPVRVRYMGVRSPEGEYLGTLELVEDFADAKEHFAKKTN